MLIRNQKIKDQIERLCNLPVLGMLGESDCRSFHDGLVDLKFEIETSNMQGDVTVEEAIKISRKMMVDSKNTGKKWWYRFPIIHFTLHLEGGY